jgi:hypothetical protein
MYKGKPYYPENVDYHAARLGAEQDFKALPTAPEGMRYRVKDHFLHGIIFLGPTDPAEFSAKLKTKWRPEYAYD